MVQRKQAILLVSYMGLSGLCTKVQEGLRDALSAKFVFQAARVTSPTAEAMRSDRIQSEFKSPVTHQILRE
jgi:hypothetical protein